MANAVQERYFDILISKIREDRYPSQEYMNRVEALLADEEQVEDYANTLLDKIQRDRFPSLGMLDRVFGLSQQLQ